MIYLLLCVFISSVYVNVYFVWCWGENRIVTNNHRLIICNRIYEAYNQLFNCNLSHTTLCVLCLMVVDIIWGDNFKLIIPIIRQALLLVVDKLRSFLMIYLLLCVFIMCLLCVYCVYVCEVVCDRVCLCGAEDRIGSWLTITGSLSVTGCMKHTINFLTAIWAIQPYVYYVWWW